ncbi:MAG: branched-chain amino acid aminotransferase [Chitinivibrionales bacterium]|nr:branched-chain amino acid aminotransferase [Chitinivibrionales bacterium]
MKPTIDWKNLGFGYIDTGVYLTIKFAHNEWQPMQICSEPYLKLHIAATCMHYGQACFEGMKAFTQKDGSVKIFRPQENARRMKETAERILMVAPPEQLFVDAVIEVVQRNIDYVPPYGTGASLYIRPLLIGTSPHIGIHESEEYLFLILVTPVGPYYKNGFFPIKAYIQTEYDRAAPRGVGCVKVAGNYAAGLKPDKDMKSQGYSISLYLDSATHTFIDEFGTSNFIGISADKKYVTPYSPSILQSITNKSLQTLAQDMGYTIEKRPIQLAEMSSFIEVGACGTAAVITPIYSIRYNDTDFIFGRHDCAGETLSRLYKELVGIQNGDIPDRHHWMIPVKS